MPELRSMGRRTSPSRSSPLHLDPRRREGDPELRHRGHRTVMHWVRRLFLPADPHRHQFEITTEHSHAPCPPGPPHHTMFFVVLCRCGALDVFPKENYDRTTPDFRAAFEAEMRSKGYRWYEQEQ